MKKFSFLNYYLKPTGRIGRAEYFVAAIIIYLILVLFSVIMYFISSCISNHVTILWLIVLFIIMVVAPCTLANINLMIKRLHDINISGKWAVIIWLIIIIPDIIQKYMGVSDGVGVITAIFLLFKKGTEGPNRYDTNFV